MGNFLLYIPHCSDKTDEKNPIRMMIDSFISHIVQIKPYLDTGDTSYDSNVLPCISTSILQQTIDCVFVFSYNMLKDLVISGFTACFEKTRFTAKLRKYHLIFIFTIWDKEKIFLCTERFFHLFLHIY